MRSRTLRALLAVAGIGAAAIGYASWRAMRLPPNAPARMKALPRKAGTHVVVCAGASLTHGVLSYDYVGDIAARLEPEGFRFVNAGVNGDLAYNLGLRLEEIIACDPDFVLVLVGTNDILAATNPKMTGRYMRWKKLPERPSYDWYELQLRRIVSRLKAETRARIALMTLPLLGEDLEHGIHGHLQRYNELIRQVAHEEGLTLLDLSAELEARLRASGHKPRKGFDTGAYETWLMFKLPLARYLLGWSLDRISDSAGLYFTPDLIHLNERGGRVLADLVEGFLRTETQSASA